MTPFSWWVSWSLLKKNFFFQQQPKPKGDGWWFDKKWLCLPYSCDCTSLPSSAKEKMIRSFDWVFSEGWQYCVVVKTDGILRAMSWDFWLKRICLIFLGKNLSSRIILSIMAQVKYQERKSLKMSFSCLVRKLSDRSLFFTISLPSLGIFWSFNSSVSFPSASFFATKPLLIIRYAKWGFNSCGFQAS